MADSVSRIDHAGPYALGTFGLGTEMFPGLVCLDKVLDLRGHLDVTTLLDVLAMWREVLPKLPQLAEVGGEWIALEDVTIAPPLMPRQIFQAGANYRKHVIELICAEHDGSDGRSPDEVRAWAGELMDRRAAEGDPYVFTGLPTALTGAYNVVELPGDGAEHDWELELAVVIGQGGRDIPEARALDHVAGYTICNDVTSRDRVYRPDLPGIGTD